MFAGRVNDRRRGGPGKRRLPRGGDRRAARGPEEEVIPKGAPHVHGAPSEFLPAGILWYFALLSSAVWDLDLSYLIVFCIFPIVTRFIFTAPPGI